jgi:hypothetical protein
VLAWLAVAVVCIALTSSATSAIVDAWTSRAAVSAVRRRLDCLEAQLRASVPAGAAVAIDETDEGEYQRLAEFVGSRGTVVPPSAAEFTVSIGPATEASPCDTLTVHVSRR